ncbi:lymphatic vessel endothelial hyaluronic acid receptor 1 [Gastrophryne carolinensis]
MLGMRLLALLIVNNQSHRVVTANCSDWEKARACAFDTDLVPLKCRVAGVALVERMDRIKKFNYTMAEDACEALGMELASRAQVEKAWTYGFETCSYGWVVEKYGVISRIQNNEKCGRNMTGVLTWTIPLSGFFNAYCFNASDIRINSCKPGLMVTIPPSTVALATTAEPAGSTLAPQTPPTSTAPQEETTVRTILPTTATESSRHYLETTLMTTLIPTANNLPANTRQEEMTPHTTEEPLNQPEDPVARKKDKIVFGGLPTALLILALLFFVAAVGLAICYVRKYKTNMIFRKIKEEKENVEAKVFRDMGDRAAELTIAREEKQQLEASSTGKSIEAEV